MNAVNTNANILVDVMGKQYAVGQTVVRPISLTAAGTCGLEIRKVAKIQNGKLYLENGGSTPIKFPERLAIVG